MHYILHDMTNCYSKSYLGFPQSRAWNKGLYGDCLCGNVIAGSRNEEQEEWKWEGEEAVQMLYQLATIVGELMLNLIGPSEKPHKMRLPVVHLGENNRTHLSTRCHPSGQWSSHRSFPLPYFQFALVQCWQFPHSFPMWWHQLSLHLPGVSPSSTELVVVRVAG